MAIEQPAAMTALKQVPNERLAVLATSTAFFMIVLDTSIVNLALPSIGAELGSPLTGLQWIVDGYALGSHASCSVPDRWPIVTAPSAFSWQVLPYSLFPRRYAAWRRRQ